MSIFFYSFFRLGGGTKKENYSALCSFAVHINYMNVFDPESLAKMMMPASLLNEASSLYFALHLGNTNVQALVIEPDSAIVRWHENFIVPQEHMRNFEDIAQFIQERNWHTAAFRRTSLSFDGPEFTLAPEGFVVEGHEKQLLLTDSSTASFEITVDRIEDAGAKLITKIPEAIHALGFRFPGASLYPSAALFAKYTLGQRKNEGNDFHVYVEPQFMLLIAFQKGEMKVVNQYGAQGHEDVLYHIANAAIRLGADLEKATVTLYGTGASASLKDLLYTYTQQVELWKAPLPLKIENAHLSFPTLVHLLCA
jgi:hypothetical protein